MLPPLVILYIFPFVVILLFATMKPIKAMSVTIIAGYLFLPHGQGKDFPMLPALDKEFIPAFCAMLMLMIMLARKKVAPPYALPGWIPRSPATLILLATVLAAILGMTLTNRDALVYGDLVLPGMTPYDIASRILTASVMLLPFFLARRFLGHPDMHLLLLRLLVAAGLGYSLLALYEVRMSPQLNIDIYGYFQHDWKQHVRRDGFRPIVFLQHGLWVSLFLSTAALSALVLFRASVGQPRARYLAAAVWLLATIFLTKSLGAFMITLVLAPVILFLNPRQQLLTAVVVALAVTSYPMLRSIGAVPIDKITAFAESIDPARAESFATRLENEDLLLAKAEERPLFGWGTWGRNRVYEDNGRGITIPDGFWIILIGSRGWVGYIGFFGLLSVGIVGLMRHSGRIEITPATAGLAVVLAGNLIDMIPNATLTPLTWMMAGALLGRLEQGKLAAPDQSEPTPPTEIRTSRYSRFGPGRRPGPQPAPARPRPSYSSVRVRNAD